MFNFGLKARIAELEFQLKSANQTIDAYRQRDESIDNNAEVIADVQSSTFVIDWHNMDAFSIERMGDRKATYTVIGHWVDNNGTKEIHEWKFFCSKDQHEKLAKEFAEYVKSRIEE